MSDTCTHDEASKDTAMANGLCLVCMMDEINRLVRVLLWYADPEHYLRGAPGENTPRNFIPPAWICDVGSRARDALKGGEG